MVNKSEKSKNEDHVPSGLTMSIRSTTETAAGAALRIEWPANTRKSLRCAASTVETGDVRRETCARERLLAVKALV